MTPLDIVEQKTTLQGCVTTSPASLCCMLSRACREPRAPGCEGPGGRPQAGARAPHVACGARRDRAADGRPAGVPKTRQRLLHVRHQKGASRRERRRAGPSHACACFEAARGMRGRCVIRAGARQRKKAREGPASSEGCCPARSRKNGACAWCVYVHACVRACARACVRACVRPCFGCVEAGGEEHCFGWDSGWGGAR